MRSPETSGANSSGLYTYSADVPQAPGSRQSSTTTVCSDNASPSSSGVRKSGRKVRACGPLCLPARPIGMRLLPTRDRVSSLLPHRSSGWRDRRSGRRQTRPDYVRPPDDDDDDRKASCRLRRQRTAPPAAPAASREQLKPTQRRHFCETDDTVVVVADVVGVGGKGRPPSTLPDSSTGLHTRRKSNANRTRASAAKLR